MGNNLCSFCGKSPESYSHLFWNCEMVKSLWNDLVEYFQLEELRNLVWKDIHLGLEGVSNKIKLCNTLIFIIKYKIYKARSRSITPTLAELKDTLITYRKEEYDLATKRNKIACHLLKWECLNSL